MKKTNLINRIALVAIAALTWGHTNSQAAPRAFTDEVETTANK